MRIIRSCPTTAKRDVKHDILLRNDIACLATVGTGPRRLGSAPRTRIRITGGDVRWNALVVWKLPDCGAGIRVNEKRVHRSTSSVESSTKCGRGRVLITTTGVGIRRARTAFVHKAGADRRLRNSLRIARSGRARMEGKLIDRGVVHAFNDVDLATFRPVRADGPQGGPHTAAIRHLCDIEQHQPR